MLIQEALKETGLATVGGAENSWHIHWNSLDSCFYRTYENGKIERYKVGMKALGRDDWQPYHEAKEIRPEKAGELWERKGIHYAIGYLKCRDGIYQTQYGLHRFDCNDYKPVDNNMIHGKNGWTRLFPKPENDSVERIEIEGVVCKEDSDCVYTVETTFTSHKDLVNKPMKMILIPKEG
jgi:hypothetical protein